MPSPDAHSQSVADSLFASWLLRQEIDDSIKFDDLLSRHPEHEQRLLARHNQWLLAQDLTTLPPSLHAPVPGGPSALADEPLLRNVPQVQNYRVLDPCLLYFKLGEGGMGAVYLAHHLRLDLPVAVKCMRVTDRSSAESSVRRFQREARIAASVSHQNLMRVHDVLSWGDLHYMVMEYVAGENARERVRRKQALPIGEAIEIVLRTAMGLDEAHMQGIIHRDIKPDNILIGAGGQVKLADLGLAKALQSIESFQTQSEATMGTPYYMPPEQWRDASEVGPPADVYALGATLYMLLVGRDAYAGLTAHRIMHQVEHGEFPDPRDARADLPAEVAEIVLRATRREAGERYGDAGEILKALVAVAQDVDLTDPESGQGPIAEGAVSSRPSSAVLMRVKQELSSGTPSEALPTQPVAPKPEKRRIVNCSSCGARVRVPEKLTEGARPCPRCKTPLIWSSVGGKQPEREPAQAARPARTLLAVAGGLLACAGLLWLFTWGPLGGSPSDTPPIKKIVKKEKESDPPVEKPTTEPTPVHLPQSDLAGLVEASAVGNTWQLIARTANEPARAYTLAFLERSENADSVHAVLSADGLDEFWLLAGSVGETSSREKTQLVNAGSEPREEALVLRPVAEANLAASVAPAPFAGAPIVLTASADAFRGCGGSSTLELERRAASPVAALQARAGDYQTALRQGSTWRGTAASKLGSREVELTVVENSFEAGALRLVMIEVDDPWKPIVLEGSLATEPVELRGWPVRLEKPGGQTGEGTGPLFDRFPRAARLRLIGSERLVGVCMDMTLDLARVDSLFVPLHQRLARALTAGAHFEGTLRPASGPALDIEWTVVEVSPDMGAVRSIVSLADDPGYVLALNGTVIGAGDVRQHSWPLQLTRKIGSGWHYRDETSLFGRHEIQVTLRALSDGTLLGLCRRERIELRPSGRVLTGTNLHGDGLRSMWESVCASETVWHGTSQLGSEKAIELDLDFREYRGLDQLEANVISQNHEEHVGQFGGSVALDDIAANSWPLRLKRTNRFSSDGPLPVLGRFESELLLRLDADGRLVGWCGPYGRLEFQRYERSAQPPLRTEPGPASNSNGLWALLRRADGLLDSREPKKASKLIEQAKNLLEPGSDQRVLVELRGARSIFEEGRELRVDSTRVKKKANALYVKANRRFESIMNGRKEIRDPDGVSVRAQAGYYFGYSCATLAYTGGIQFWAKRADNALKFLTEKYSEEKDANGRAWVDRLYDDLRVFKRNSR